MPRRRRARGSATASSSSRTTTAPPAAPPGCGGSCATSATRTSPCCGAASSRGSARCAGGEEAIEPAEFVPRPRTGDTIEAEELQARLGEPGLTIVDARSPERYRGEAEPIDPVAGRIPGAVNWPYGTELPPGIAEAGEIVVYCGSGVTACVDLLTLAQAGRPDAKLYPGSWSEWCGRGLPAELG